MSMSVVALAVALWVIPRWHRWVVVVSASSSIGGFATAVELGAVLPVVSGVVLLAAASAGTIAVVVVCEGVQAGVSFVPASL